MKRPIAFTTSLLFAAIGLSAAPARAQDPVTTAVAVAAPIIVHTIVRPKKRQPSGTWMKAEVLHADNNSVVVSEQANERMIHTFTYSPEVKAKMQKIIDSGGYQYGDRIKIQYAPGQTVALKIHGKPSKPATAFNTR
ncbi:MAG TPA: hypothetical protein VJS43_14900 [Candidatus Acidoferrales bacterium]|nr:hypothetical protein [Candidatus Acidoferrales bacterium]